MPIDLEFNISVFFGVLVFVLSCFFFFKPILFECHLNRVDGGTFTYFDGFLIILSCSN